MEPDEELKRNLPYGKVPFPKLGEPLPDNMRHAIQTHVTQNRESLDWLRRGTAVAECRQSEDHVDVGDREALKHFSKSWRGMDILNADALLSVTENRTDDALCAFLNYLAASNSHWRKTLYMAHLFKAAGAFYVFDPLEWSLSVAAFSDEQLVALASAIEPFANDADFWRGFVGYRCVLLSRLSKRDVQKGAYGAVVYLMSLKEGSIVPLFWQNALAILESYELGIQSAREPGGSLASFRRVAERTAERAAKSKNRALDAGLMLNSMRSRDDAADFCMLSQDRFVDACGDRLRMMACGRIILTALAAKRYFLKNGVLPENVDLLTPEYLPAAQLDPFDDQPLRYRKDADGAVIYSIGPDKVDDGGMEKPSPREYYPKGDIVFQVR